MNKKIKRWLITISSIVALSASAVTAFAEDAATETSSGTDSGGQLVSMLIMIAAFFVMGYFFIIRPEKKRKKEADVLRDSLRPGNRITTIGGIVGTVEKVTEEEIFLTNGLVLKRWALRSIDETAEDGKSSAVMYYEEDENAEKETNGEEGENK